jgi:aminoglycoside 3-N-acetyltransferase
MVALLFEDTKLNLADLSIALSDLGISPGEHVLTHSSLKSVGHVEGGAATVVTALREAVGPDGTALFPTHTWGPNQNPDNPPAFDARTARSVVGLVSETARTMPGGIRSLSPTHSVVAFGAQAEWLCGAHHRSLTPCGVDSPYERLCQVGGKILLLGCDHESNTSLHMVEELADLPYQMIPGFAEYAITGIDGQPVQIRARFHAWGTPRCFNRIEPMLVASGAQFNGKVGNAEARLIDAAKTRDLVLEKLLEDPDYLKAARG